MAVIVTGSRGNLRLFRSRSPVCGRFGGTQAPPLSCQFRKPFIQNRDTAWLYGGEPDPHPRAFPRIGNPALGGEYRSVVPDPESDLCPVRERPRRLDKTPEQTQILYVRSDVSFRVEGSHLDSGDEWKTLRAMAVERDGRTSIVSRFYSSQRYGERKPRMPVAI